ncbi:MAG: 4Fe-4S binding protein [Firmicutes bacterium]|nr:4Fe-4S binding protein [Bacillota bacterium]
MTSSSQTKNLLKTHQAIDDSIKPNAGWRDLPIGAVIPRGGTAEEFATGDWRTIRPVWSEEKCIHCHRCWLYCPDMSWISQDGKIQKVDLQFCKGCGICANVCPTHAIEMHPEDNFKADEAGKEG